jgi:hypothetical protein
MERKRGLMKLVAVVCEECKFSVTHHNELHYPSGKMVETLPEKGNVFCDNTQINCSGDEYTMQMPKDGFCSYGKPKEK